MSTIQISDELIENIQKILADNDEACKDAGIGIQYMAAIIGFMLSQFPGDIQEKKNMLNHLFGFANHVLEENVAQEENKANDDAMGIWKPE